MSEHDNPQTPQESPGAAAPKRERLLREPILIDGEAVEAASEAQDSEGVAASAPKVAAAVDIETHTPPTPNLNVTSARPARRSQGWLASAMAGALGGALAAAGLLWAYANFIAPPDAGARIASLEAGASDRAALDKRLKALEGQALDLQQKTAAAAAALPRVGALETAVGALKSDLATASTNPPQLASAQTDVDKTTNSSALEARLGKVEASLAAATSAVAAMAPLGERLGKVEDALAAPKSETRAAAEAAKPPLNSAAALAVAAQSLSERFDAGSPYEGELAAAQALGAQPETLAALKPFAKSGALTISTLGADFAKLAPLVLAAAAPAGDGGAMDRISAALSSLVKVRPVGVLAGEGIDALVSQAGAALGAHDVNAALALVARLPDAARAPLQGWVANAQARQSAAAAAEALRVGAMQTLSKGKS